MEINKFKNQLTTKLWSNSKIFFLLGFGESQYCYSHSFPSLSLSQKKKLLMYILGFFLFKKMSVKMVLFFYFIFKSVLYLNCLLCFCFKIIREWDQTPSKKEKEKKLVLY
jgi:hypothetical protein